MIWELKDAEGDLVSEFGSRDDALSAVAERFRSGGRDAVESLGLAWYDPDRGRGGALAAGAALADLAARQTGGPP